MNRRGFLMSATALVLAGCSTAPVSCRQRLTLIVETPEGLVSGAGVIEYVTAFQDGWLGGMAGHALVSSKIGQAVIVDLQTHGLLFALLRADDARKPSFGAGSLQAVSFPQIMASAEHDGGGVAEREYTIFYDRLNELKPKAMVPLAILPLLVRFTDPENPSTVERVEPFDLSAAFGPGVKLIGATLEIVDAPVTSGIEKKLPWLNHPNETVGIVKYPGPEDRAGKNLDAFQYHLTYYDFWEGMG